MAYLSAGPVVLYGGFVSQLLVQFFIFPALLLSGRHTEEDIWRRSHLLTTCAVIILELLWANYHPQPVRYRTAATAAVVASASCCIHLVLAFGLIGGFEYAINIAIILQVATYLPWVLVSQHGTAFVVSSNRSPARFQILAWITVMVLGSLVTLFPVLRAMRMLTVTIVVLPRFLVAVALTCTSRNGSSMTREKPMESADNPLTVALPRAARFAFFAANGSSGEALNDMATDLKIRSALSTGDTTLTLSYNAAVLLSMFGGLASETAASGDGARCVFAVLWGMCQAGRSFGMQYLTPDRIWLMFAFVFCDKFSGPLGQAAIDTALLSLMRRHGGGSGSARFPRIPANAIWTLRTATERLERPVCQLLLLSLGRSSAPWWLPQGLAALAVGFVLHTLCCGASKDHDKST